MLAVSLKDRVVYHPTEMEKVYLDDSDEDGDFEMQPKPGATEFHLRALSAEELAHLQDAGLSIRGQNNIRMNTGSATLLAVRMGLSNVKGLADPDDGGTISFETERPSKAFDLPPFWKNDREVVSRRFLRRLGTDVLHWIAQQLTEQNQLSETDVGNSSEDATDDGILASENPAQSASAPKLLESD